MKYERSVSRCILAFAMLGAVLAGHSAIASAAREVIYVQPLGTPEAVSGARMHIDWRIVVNADGRGQYFVGEIVGPLSTCSEEEQFYCLRLEEPRRTNMFFAVPKRALIVGESWEQGGRAFTVAAFREDWKVLGRSASVYVIEARPVPGDVTLARFLYSEEDGLLAFEFRAAEKEQSEHDRSFYLLQGKCGFGADKHCWQPSSG